MTINQMASSDETGWGFHDLANIFPLATDEQLRDLAADIAEHGLRDSIILYGGQVLDGRSRLLACAIAGIEPKFEQFTGNDAFALVVSKNLHRRQLDESQRAMVAAKMADLAIGANQHTLGMPIGRAADLLNVSARSAARARKVLKSGDVDLIKAVETGDVPVSRAAKSAHDNQVSDSDAAEQVAADAGDQTDGVMVAPSAAATADGRDSEQSNTDDVRSSRRRSLSCDTILEPRVTFITGHASAAVLPVAVKIGATVSAGDYFPDCGRARAGDVGWLTTQLDADRRFRSQFDAARADQHRLHFLDPIRDDFGLPVRNLSEDLHRLERDGPPDTTCVVVDYLSEYFLDGMMDRLKIGRLQNAVTVMQKFAEKRRVAILAVGRLPSRDRRQVDEAINEIASWPDVGAVLRVARSNKPTSGTVKLSANETERVFSFQLRQRKGEVVVMWDGVPEPGGSRYPRRRIAMITVETHEPEVKANNCSECLVANLIFLKDARKAWAIAHDAVDFTERLQADLNRQSIVTLNAYADACAADPYFDRQDCSIRSRPRALLVLANASPDPATRAKAAFMAEKIRFKLNLNWNQLLAREADDDLDGDDLNNDDLDDDVYNEGGELDLDDEEGI